MYAVAGMYLGRVDDLPIVEWTGRAWLWVALTAWPLVLLAVLHALFTTGGRSTPACCAATARTRRSGGSPTPSPPAS
ncbi:hypothetical protein ACWDUG_34495, partial [Streptomyces cellulosae]